MFVSAGSQILGVKKVKEYGAKGNAVEFFGKQEHRGIILSITCKVLSHAAVLHLTSNHDMEDNKCLSRRQL